MSRESIETPKWKHARLRSKMERIPLEHDRVKNTRLPSLWSTLLGLSPSQKRCRRWLLSPKRKLLNLMNYLSDNLCLLLTSLELRPARSQPSRHPSSSSCGSPPYEEGNLNSVNGIARTFPQHSISRPRLEKCFHLRKRENDRAHFETVKNA